MGRLHVRPRAEHALGQDGKTSEKAKEELKKLKEALGITNGSPTYSSELKPSERHLLNNREASSLDIQWEVLKAAATHYQMMIIIMTHNIELKDSHNIRL